MIDFLKQTFGESVTEETITAFKNELGRKFVAKADYNTKRDELNEAREKISLLESQADEFSKNAGDKERLQQELDALKQKYDEHVSVLNGKIEQMKTDGEISLLIRKSGGKNEKAVRALLDLTGENIMEDAKEQLDLLKKSEPYLFDTHMPDGSKGNFPRSTFSNTGSLTYSQMMQLEANKNF